MESPTSIAVTSFDSREACGGANGTPSANNNSEAMEDRFPSSHSSNCLAVSETEPKIAATVRRTCSTAALPSGELASPIYRPLVVSRRHPSAISLERHGSFAFDFSSARDDSDDDDDDDSVNDEHCLNTLGLDLDDDDSDDESALVSREMRSIQRVSSDMALRASELSIDDSGGSNKSSRGGRRSSTGVSPPRLPCAMVPDIIRIEDDVIEKAIQTGKLRRTKSQGSSSVGGSSKMRRNLSFSVVHEDRREHVVDDADDAKEEGAIFDVEDPTCKDEAPADAAAAPFSPFGSLPPIAKEKSSCEKDLNMKQDGSMQ